MNFGLLWIDALLIALLWVGALTACVARAERRWVRNAILFLVVLFPLGALGSFVVWAAAMKFSMNVEPNWFGYAVLLLFGWMVGTSLILRQAAGCEPAMPPAAAAWRRGPLAFAWLAAIAVGYMTLVNMDLAVRARCAILSVEINSVYLATLPAITSESQNAAPIYEKAFAQLRDGQEDERKVQNPPTGNGDDFDPNETATITFLARQAGTIALLRRAAALPACRFDSDLMHPDVNVIIPTLNRERNAANVLNLHAREEIARGHVSSAIDDAAAIYGMSRHFGERPLMLSALIGIGIDALGNKTVEEALPAVKSRDELAGLRQEQLPSLGHVFQQALRGEESFGVTLYSNMPTSQMEAAEGNASQSQATVVPSFGGGLQGAFLRAFMLDLDDYIKLMANLQDSAGQPYYAVRSQVSQIFGLDRHRGLLLSIVAPSFSRLLQSLAIGEANDACAETAVAMTRYRLDHGMLPSHLGDLVPAYLDAVPIDPFDGKPLRLAIKNNQWIIYSVGPDRVDDGGIEINRGKGDVIFTLTLAPKDATTKP
jgi:hypothetical protein